MGRLAIDLSGQRFGKLLVVSRVENRGGRPAWMCHCDCGNSKDIRAENLRSGATQSCGCQESLGVSPLDLTGKRFDKLVALSLVSVKPPVWKCQCDCGGVVEVRASYLNSDATTIGRQRDCGCSWKGVWKSQRHYVAATKISVKLRKRPFESLYNNLKARAKRKGLEVFTYEDFLEFTAVLSCHYCASSLVWAKYGVERRGRAANLDRKDSKLGYIKGNVVPCCIRCNRAKLDHFTYDEWVKIGAFIRDNIIRGHSN